MSSATKMTKFGRSSAHAKWEKGVARQTDNNARVITRNIKQKPSEQSRTRTGKCSPKAKSQHHAVEDAFGLTTEISTEISNNASHHMTL
jgi:hypothetical protein